MNKSVTSVDIEMNTKLNEVSERLKREQKIVLGVQVMSWILNCVMLMMKVVATYLSRSLAIGASLCDSTVDLCIQIVLLISNRVAKKKSPQFPRGTTKYQEIGILVCACITFMVCIEIIQYSVIAIYARLTGREYPLLDGPVIYLMLSAGAFLKLCSYLVCNFLRKKIKSPILQTLTDDHLNDTLSCISAMASSFIAIHVPNAWWMDPAGAITMTLIIFWRWCVVVVEQNNKLIGLSAPVEFLNEIDDACKGFPYEFTVDDMIAYYYGAKYAVEISLSVSRSMIVSECHDLQEALKAKVEALSNVHVCYIKMTAVKCLESDIRKRSDIRQDFVEPIEKDFFLAQQSKEHRLSLASFVPKRRFSQATAQHVH